MSTADLASRSGQDLETRQLARWWAVDLLLATFLVGTALFVLVFRDRVPGAGWVALGHLAAWGLFLTVKRTASREPRLRLLYLFLPYGIVVGIFEALGFIIPYVRAAAVESLAGDAVLARADLALFGSDPTRWFDGLLGPASTTILQICYTTYYFLPLLLGVVLVRRGKYRTALSYVGVVVGCFLTTYVGYYLVPAYGPRLFYIYESALPMSGLAAWVYGAIDALDNIALNAFPSGHTAVTLLCLYLLWRESWRLALAVLPICLGLVVSTIALRYHYAVDVLAGLLVAAGWACAGLPAVLRHDAGCAASTGEPAPAQGQGFRALEENLPPSA